MMSSLELVYYDVISFSTGFMTSSFLVSVMSSVFVKFYDVISIHFRGHSSGVIFDVSIFCDRFTHSAMTSLVLHRRLRL